MERRIHYFDNYCYVESIDFYKLDFLHTKVLQKILDGVEIAHIPYYIQRETNFSLDVIRKTLHSVYETLKTIFYTKELNSIKEISSVSGVPNFYYPYVLQIALTNRCVLRCKHCYVESEMTGVDLDYAKLCMFLDRLVGKVPIITFTGGEPLLYSYIFELISEYSLKFAININTSLAKKIDNVDIFRSVNLIQTSIYGSDAEAYEEFTNRKNSFSVFEENVRVLREKGIPVAASYHLKSEDKGSDNLKRIIEKCIELDICQIKIGEIFSKGRAVHSHENFSIKYSDFEDEILNLIHKYKDDIVIKYDCKEDNASPNSGVFTCGAGEWSLNISELGELHPCSLFLDRIVSIGNIYIGDVGSFFCLKKKREEYFSKILNFISLDMLDCCEKINVRR